MDCCLLTDREVGRFTHYGILPNHKEHIHLSAEQAIKGLKTEKYELVKVMEGHFAVKETKVYFLVRTPSGPLDTIQRVKRNHILELKPIK